MGKWNLNWCGICKVVFWWEDSYYLDTTSYKYSIYVFYSMTEVWSIIATSYSLNNCSSLCRSFQCHENIRSEVMCDEFLTHFEFHCIEERLQNAERVLTVAEYLPQYESFTWNLIRFSLELVCLTYTEFTPSPIMTFWFIHLFIHVFIVTHRSTKTSPSSFLYPPDALHSLTIDIK